MLKNTLLALCLHDDQQERFLKELWFIFMPKLALVIMLDVVNERSCVLLFFFPVFDSWLCESKQHSSHFEYKVWVCLF